MSEVIQLPLPRKKSANSTLKISLPVVSTARKVTLGNELPETLNTLNNTHGVIGDYQPGIDHAVTHPIAESDITSFYIWDSECQLPKLNTPWQQSGVEGESVTQTRVAGNLCDLNNNEVEGPEIIINDDDQSTLQLNIDWQLLWETTTYGASLGLIHLVDSQRFLTLENGEQVSIINSSEAEAPVLYIEEQNQSAVKEIFKQKKGEQNTFNHKTTISQTIPNTFDGHAVEAVTVLEQYRSYFMQRPLEDDNAIWVPVISPISWGWSIRVARRYDGPWTIVRRKLIMPTVGHDGLELPLWSDNSLAYANTELL